MDTQHIRNSCKLKGPNRGISLIAASLRVLQEILKSRFRFSHRGSLQLCVFLRVRCVRRVRGVCACTYGCVCVCVCAHRLHD